MLQRAASNAYSWWAASHIRTKQSKWLEQSLHDMQGRVESVIKLIEEDGDSFARRAEMYYKKRPELINFVEESYRAYRALAERYDHLSKELQTANNTIATIFPEQIQLAMDEEDEFGAPKMPKDFPQVPPSGSSIPKVPKPPKELKGLMRTASKQREGKKLSETDDVSKSGLTKSEAVEEIDKLQKEILALQTVKEFIRSSYQSGLEKFRGLENQIMEKQQKICELEDEFGEGRVIEDGEACTLMAEAALQSCQETLTQLQEKQETFTQEAKEEFKKIEDACQKLNSFKHKYLGDQIHEAKVYNISNHEANNKEIESLQAKIQEQIDASSKGSLTMSQLAEKIDELVTKVISLETAVTYQTLLIERLRAEADELITQVHSLEDHKAAMTDDSHNLNARVTAIEAKLQAIENLNKDVVNQNSTLRTHFVEARANIDHLSDKLSTVQPDEELDETDSSPDEATTLVKITLDEEPVKQKDHPSSAEGSKNISPMKTEGPKNFSTTKTEGPKNISTVKTEGSKNFSTIKTEDRVCEEQGYSTVVSDQTNTTKHVTFAQPTPAGKGDKNISGQSVNSSIYETQTQKDAEKDDELSWQQMLLSGLEDKEDILLHEYTTVLKNYKEVTKKLNDLEKKDRDAEFERALYTRELKSSIAKRDEEIHNLRRQLIQLKHGNALENKELQEEPLQVKPEDLPQTKDIDTPIIENDEDNIKTILVDQRATVSPIKEKLRMSIDAILDENLDFLLRFSSSFNQIKKFKTTVHDLENEISKSKVKEMQGNSPRVDVKSEIRPIYKHMKEIQNELTMWLEQTLSLKDELERRFSALCNIQEEITKVIKDGVEEEIGFSSHQAAKFQGEVLNMKQENKKVREELEAGVYRVTTLQVEVEKIVTQLDQEFGLAGNQSQLMNSVTKTRIPLHSFIFGTKPKKTKRSVFSRISSRKS